MSVPQAVNKCKQGGTKEDITLKSNEKTRQNVRVSPVMET